MATLDWISKRKYGWVKCDTVTHKLIPCSHTCVCLGILCQKECGNTNAVSQVTPVTPFPSPVSVPCELSAKLPLQFSIFNTTMWWFFLKRLVSSFPISLSIYRFNTYQLDIPKWDNSSWGTKRECLQRAWSPLFSNNSKQQQAAQHQTVGEQQWSHYEQQQQLFYLRRSCDSCPQQQLQYHHVQPGRNVDDSGLYRLCGNGRLSQRNAWHWICPRQLWDVSLKQCPSNTVYKNKTQFAILRTNLLL